MYGCSSSLMCFFALSLCLISCSSGQPLNADTNVIELRYYSDDPVIDMCSEGPVIPTTSKSVCKSVKIPGLENRVVPGEPVLPFRTVKILLPYGEEIEEIEVMPGEKKNLGKIFIEPGQEPVPISRMDDSSSFDIAPLNETIYESMEPYPKELYSILGLQEKLGYKILYINLHPIMYIPKTKDAYYFGTFDVKVTTTPMLTLDKDLFRGSSQDEAVVLKMVDNNEEVATYSSRVVPITSSPLLNGECDYVIITNQYLKNAPEPYNFQTLADWKRSKGLSAEIVAVEDIYDFYDGIDEQEKIRNFIRDAYYNNDLSYVLLGGDADGSRKGGTSGDNIVPVRGLWAWNYDSSPPNIPSDLYYACLDGSYDYNGNGIYGEMNDGTGGGDVDLLAEVYVGRAPVDSYEELSNFVRKTIAYERSVGDPYLSEILMVGEYLGFGGIGDWGGNSKDETKGQSDANGYDTRCFSDNFHIQSLYDRDHDWSKSELMTLINQNVHSINHLGHAGIDGVMKMDMYDIALLSNDKYFLGYSQGCYAGTFDNRNPDGIYLPQDCILEHFVTTSHGAFAFIGNSRFGWARKFTTDGPSQRYDRQFWNAIFGEDIRNIGRANQASKEANLGSIDESIDGKSMRFCYYGLNLLGDPETPYHMPLASRHDVEISAIQLPSYIRSNKTVQVDAIVENNGVKDEHDIEVQLLENGVVKGSHIIPYLSSGASTTVTLPWSRDFQGNYTLEMRVVPIVGEENIENNYKNKSIEISSTSGSILLVDDDEGANYETYYEDALAANGYKYVKIDTSPNFEELNAFDCVIWFTGRDFTMTLTSDDQMNLAAFLDNGGNLFISGQDIGYNIQGSDFYEKYLHSEYMKDNVGHFSLEGVSGDPITDGMLINISGGDSANNQYWPSEILPTTSYAFEIFKYQRRGCGAIRADTGTYKLVYFAFGFESIDSPSDRMKIMDAIIKYLSGDSIAKDVTYVAAYSMPIDHQSVSNLVNQSGHFEYNSSDVPISTSRLDVSSSMVPEKSISYDTIVVPTTVAIKEPEQYGQYCEHKLISGTGAVLLNTSITDRQIALDYSNYLSGTGRLDMDSTQAYSQDASRLVRPTLNGTSLNGTSPNKLNFYESTKMQFDVRDDNGDLILGAADLAGEKYLGSKGLYGGMNADISENFRVNRIDKDQSAFFGTTNNSTIAHTVGLDVVSDFNGSWGTQAHMKKIFYKEVRDDEQFSGEFQVDKEIKFHEDPTLDVETNPCECLA